MARRYPTAPGKVRQFVAMPIGGGYAVEAQLTGAELKAGIQFEIVPRCALSDFKRSTSGLWISHCC